MISGGRRIKSKFCAKSTILGAAAVISGIVTNALFASQLLQLMCLDALHDRGLKTDKYWHCTLRVYSTWRKLPVGRSVVVTELLKINPD